MHARLTGPVRAALAAFLVGGVLTACAQPARMNNMIAEDRQYLVAAAPDLPVRERVALGSVTGGEETNPLWTSQVGNAEFHEALRQSLLAHKLLATDPGRARYLLHAELQSVDQPMIGVDMTVTAAVRYRMVEPSGATDGSPALRFNEIVAVPYTAEFGDSLLAVERLRLANEGAIRTNISEFLDRLIKRGRSFPGPEPGTASGAGTS